jgi:hypothetical protein
MRIPLAIVICAFTAVAAQAQTSMTKPKIFISNSNDWQQAGGFKSLDKMPAQAAGGDSDMAHQNEVSAMASQCSTAEVTSEASKASYIVLWDTRAIWNALSARTNLLIMYTPQGDAVYSVRSDTMDSAARHVCSYLATVAKPAKPAKPAAEAAPTKPAKSPAEAAAASKSGL